MKYIKKPVVVEAFQFDGDFISSDGKPYVPDWAMKAFNKKILHFESTDDSPSELFIKTLEGDVHASLNDYIIKGTRGDIYPCKSDIFKEIYDEYKEEK